MDMGAYVMTPIGVPWKAGYGTLKAVTSPENTYWYMPGTAALVGGTDPFASGSNKQNDDDYKTGRHFGGINITFADGHVKWLKAETVFREAEKCTDCNVHQGATALSAWNPASSQ
jgi:prepilin-type processing-associated H-X9-DG protein